MISFILKIKHCHPTDSDEFAYPAVHFPCWQHAGKDKRQADKNTY